MLREDVLLRIGVGQESNSALQGYLRALKFLSENKHIKGSVLRSVFKRIQVDPDEPEALWLVIHELSKSALVALKQDALRLLDSLEISLAYWNSNHERPIRFFIEEGPGFWTNYFIPGNSSKLTGTPVPVSVLGWMRYTGFALNAHIAQRIDELKALHLTLVILLGKLAHHSQRLDQVEFLSTQLEKEINGCVEFLTDFLVGWGLPEVEVQVKHQSARDLLELTRLFEAEKQFRILVKLKVVELKPPGFYRRNWWILSIGTLALFSALHRIVYMSPESFSGFWCKFVELSQEFIDEHVTDPMKNLFNRLFFNRNRDQYHRSLKELNQSRKSLSKMLLDFGMTDMNNNSDLKHLHDKGNALEKAKYVDHLERSAASGDMSIVMKRYEKEISEPLKGLTTGELLRAALIQFQKLKVDTEGTIVEMDELLEQNDINIQLMATIPALLMVYPVYHYWTLKLQQRKNASTTGHVMMRSIVRKVQDLLICEYPEADCFTSVQHTGQILFYMHQLATVGKSERINHMISSRDYKMLMHDIHLLSSLSLNVSQKKQLIAKMYQTQRFLWTINR